MICGSEIVDWRRQESRFGSTAIERLDLYQCDVGPDAVTVAVHRGLEAVLREFLILGQWTAARLR